MINADLNQFLDTGWWNQDATIYYRGYIHFLDSWNDEEGMHLRIMKWRAKNIDNKRYEDIHDETGDLADFSQMFFLGEDEDDLREKFLAAPIWDGKSFWEIEQELAWLD